MPQLVLALLGPFAATLDGQPVTTFESVKVRALLAYLAVEADHPQSRAVLAELLWPELPNDAARTYLRHALGKLREAIADSTAQPPYLLATRDTVQFNAASDHVLDVASFTALLAACDAHPHRHAETCRSCARRRGEALSCYRGDFLAEVLVRDSTDFDAWAALKRERLRGQFVRATAEQAAYCIRRGDDATAQHYLERQVEVDPWDEAARRQLMTSLWRCGQRSAALAQYFHCRQVLEQDLGVDPEEATTALFTQIRDGTRCPAQDDGGSGARDTLPSPTASFVGRVAELEQLVELLQHPDCRLVTLTGPGGIGKTRLALTVAAELQDDFADGTWFVDLAPISDSSLVLSAVAQALGVQQTAGQPLQDNLQTALRAKQLLLVLDNFEQILDAAPLVSDLLHAAPRLTVLVTSRAPLHLYGEQEFPVPPLALPDPSALPSPAGLAHSAAVLLFIHRARAVKPDFQVTPATAPAVAAICVWLDGLPLAIELAAARSRLLSPAALLARLRSCLRLLTGGARDLPARQQTMRATIDWSHHLLDQAEQHLFARLAPFTGGWTLDAAEAVCDPSGDLGVDVVDGLQSLVDKSLLRPDHGVATEPRFSMFETIREYALERLAALDEVPALRRQHAAYYVALAERAEPALRGPQQRAWLERLEAERGNVWAALDWSQAGTSGPSGVELGVRLVGALWQFLLVRGSYAEGQRWSALATAPGAHAATLSSAVSAKALLAQALLEDRFGTDVRSAALAEQSLALFQAAGERWGAAMALALVGGADIWHGAVVQGRARLDEGLRLARAAGDPWLMAWVLGEAGRLVWWPIGERQQAMDFSEEGVCLARAAGDPWLIARLLMSQGYIAMSLDEFGLARARFEESLALQRTLANETEVATSLLGLAYVALEQGDYATSQRLQAERLALEQQIGNRRGTAHALRTLGQLAWAQGDAGQAQTLYDQSELLYREQGVTEPYLLYDRGRLARTQGEYERAARYVEEALAGWKAVGDRWGIGRGLVVLGQIAHAAGDDERAAGYLRESLAVRQALGHKVSIATCLASLAGVAQAQGAPVRAARLYGAAEGLRDAVGTVIPPPERALYQQEVAHVRAQLNEATFHAAWEAGRALALEQAIAEALTAVGDETTQAAAPPDSGLSRARQAPHLTMREVEVLRIVAEGATDQEAAARLGLRPRTVTTYLTRIYAKLGVRTRTAAVRVAREQHVI